MFYRYLYNISDRFDTNTYLEVHRRAGAAIGQPRRTSRLETISWFADSAKERTGASDVLM